MSTAIKRRRGTKAENAAFTGQLGEWTHDITLESIRVHDGATMGGTLQKNPGDVYADAYMTLSDAVAAVGSDVCTLVVAKTSTLNGNLTIPSTCTLRVQNGGVIGLAGYTLIVSGEFECSRVQAFSGVGSVVFSNPREVFAEWWLAEDYGVALSSAIASIHAVGGKVSFAKAGDATTPINGTAITNGMVISGMKNGVDFPVITLKHTGVGFDLTGSTDLHLENFLLHGDSATTPKVGYLLGRIQGGSSGGRINMTGVGTTAASHFTVAALYSYAAEVLNFFGCSWLNSHANSRSVCFLATNIFNVTSPFVTIRTTLESNTTINLFGCYLQNMGGANCDLLYLDTGGDLHVYGGFWYVPSGRSYVYINTTNGGTAAVSFDGVRGEVNAGTRPSYGFFFDNAAARFHSNWSITNCRFDVSTNAVYVSDNSTLNEFVYRNNIDVVGGGISVKNATYSQFDMRTNLFEGRAGGGVEVCEIWAFRNSLTISGSFGRSRFHDLQNAGERIEGSGTAGAVWLVQLDANATTTTVANTAVTANSRIFLFPATANAAADVGSATGVWISAKVANTSFTVTHPNTAATDKLFNCLILN